MVPWYFNGTQTELFAEFAEFIFTVPVPAPAAPDPPDGTLNWPLNVGAVRFPDESKVKLLLPFIQ